MIVRYRYGVWIPPGGSKVNKINSSINSFMVNIYAVIVIGDISHIINSINLIK